MENLKKLSNQEIEFQTMNLVKEERNNICNQLMLLIEINIRRIPQAAFYFNIGDYCRRHLGMTKNQAWKRSQAVRVIQFFPKLLEFLRDGETTLTNVSLLSSQMTQANEASILQFLPNRSKRELEYFLKAITKSGEILNIEPELEMTIKIKKTTDEKLRRAQMLLSINKKTSPEINEVLDEALELLLEKRDPIRKAKRAAARLAQKDEATRKTEFQTKAPPEKPKKEILPQGSCDENKSETESSWGSLKTDEIPVVDQSTHSRCLSKNTRKPIKASTKHQVFNRDHGKCTFTYPDGRRCQETRGLQIDHLKMVCHGGTNDLVNLALLCSGHNRLRSEVVLGEYRSATVHRSS